MEEGKEKLKFEASLREYSEIRQEYRTFEVLQILCISIAALIFVVMFITAVSSKQYILLFVSPLISIFFILLTLGMQVYNTNLALRASQIEDRLKNIHNDEGERLNQTLREFMKALSTDPSDWRKKVFKIYEENGMNPLDEKSIEAKLKDDPYKALELSAKVMGSIPFFKVLSELFMKYILPPRLATQNELHSTLSEQHFH